MDFSHHQAVANHDQATELLAWAEANGSTVKQLREEKQRRSPAKKEKPFDGTEAGGRLRDWLRTELDKWPDSERHEAAHWIRQILSKEYSL